MTGHIRKEANALGRFFGELLTRSGKRGRGVDNLPRRRLQAPTGLVRKVEPTQRLVDLVVRDRRSLETAAPQIIQEFRGRIDARYQQMIPCTSAGNVEQVAFGVVDLFEVRVVRDRFDPLL